MGMPMYASTPTADGRWYAVLIRPNGWVNGVVPGQFGSKEAADANAKRELGLSR